MDRTESGSSEVSSASEHSQRDAIIFIPGLFHREQENAIARRLARALDHQAETGAATFAIVEAKEEDYKESHRSRVVTLVRSDGGNRAPVPIADLYELNYEDALTGGYRQRKPVWQAIMIAAALVANFPRVLGSVTKKSKTAGEKLQVVWAGFVFLMLGLYVPILLYTAFASAYVAVRAVSGVTSPPAATAPAAGQQVVAPTDSTRLADRLSIYADRATRAVQIMVVFIAALGLFTRASLKDVLANTAAHAIPTLGYLDFDQRKGLVIGQINNLLDHLEEKGLDYRRVHILAYSFGSVVALDALFPIHEPSPRLRKVHTLMTIACPFDFMRTYWPRYFESRKPMHGVPVRWINIYCPLDLLSSDFLDVTEEAPERGLKAATREHRPDKNILYGRSHSARAGEFFTLAGFRSHQQYWERDNYYDVNAFDIVVRELFTAEPALA